MLLGEFPVYTWGTDYTGIGPLEFLGAGLMALFGPSIPLASSVSLLAWGCGVGLLVAFVGAYFDRGAMVASGCALAIGMPFYLTYNTQPNFSSYSMLPLVIGGFLWLTVLILQRGPRTWFCALTACIMGWCWYANKHALVMWLAAGVALVVMAQGREFLRTFARSGMLWICVVVFLVGYSPEILYKMKVLPHENREENAKGFLSLASPKGIVANWYMLFRSLPMYFDSDPWSRSPCGVHYLNHMENWESFPLSTVDTVGLIAAAIVVSYGIKLLRQSYKNKNFPVFMFCMIPVVNMATILVAAQSGGSYYSIRRYLLPSGIIFLVLLGARLSAAWSTRQRVVVGVLALCLAISAFHQCQLLQSPDELTDYRRMATEIVEAGYQYGISWYSYAHTLTALSDERVKFGILDFGKQSPYQTAALTQAVVAVVWPATQPPPFEFAQTLFFGGVRFKQDRVQVLPTQVNLLGANYQRMGEPHIVGELGWAPYQKLTALGNGTTTP